MNIKNIARAAIASALLSVSAFASAAPAPTDFVITSTKLTGDVGYGLNNPDLDVVFQTAVLPNLFTLEADMSKVFLFGTVDLREVCINGPQSGCENSGVETNDLDVTAEFTFSNPLGTTVQNIAVGSAVKGNVNDIAKDYSIVFDSITVDFGADGQFEIELNDLHFFANGVQELFATITLVKGIEQLEDAPTDVPEPGSLALFGLAIAAFAFARRRAAK